MPEHLLLAKLLLPVAFRARFVSAAQHSEIDRDLLTLADDLVSLKHLFRLDAADGSPLRALVGNHRLRAHLSEMT